MTPETTVLEANSCSRSEYNYMHSSLDSSSSFYPAQKCSMSSSTSSSSSSTVSDGDDNIIDKKSHILKIVDSFSKLFEDYLDIHTEIHIDRDIDLIEESDNCTYDGYNDYNNNNNNKSARMSNNCTPADAYDNYSDKDYLSNSKQSFALGSFVKRNKNHQNQMKKTRVSVNMQLLDIQ